jgi:hypothetical protein
MDLTFVVVMIIFGLVLSFGVMILDSSIFEQHTGKKKWTPERSKELQELQVKLKYDMVKKMKFVDYTPEYYEGLSASERSLVNAYSQDTALLEQIANKMDKIERNTLASSDAPSNPWRDRK